MSADIATFINIGERTNVTGSARFKRLILDGEYDDLQEQAFYMVGTIEEAVEKAKKA